MEVSGMRIFVPKKKERKVGRREGGRGKEGKGKKIRKGERRDSQSP